MKHVPLLEAIAGKKVALVAGTFDLVHIGHIRHLKYVKSKVDILVVLVTCDYHVTKGAHRPYLPQDLRLENIKALEMVDYAFVDFNPTPIEAIHAIKPAIFAKGADYAHQQNPKTQEEKEAVESHGGQMLFTPGDIMDSSTRILKESPPKLGMEKLLTLMQAEGLTFEDLRVAVNGFKGTKVHVIGDTIVDTYTYCSLIGASSKTPTLSVRYDRKEDFIGGAAVVGRHIRAAGADVEFSTALGTDSCATTVVADLESVGVKVKAFQDGRLTTQKNTLICGSARLLKLDKVDNRTINDDALAKLVNRIATVEADIVIFSDFRHGIFNSSTIRQLTSAIPKNAIAVADSQVASRWGNILDFKSFNIITPNEKEARFALGDQDSVIRSLATELYKQANCGLLILKCGEAGTFTVRGSDETDHRNSFALDSFCLRARDSVGAGDALLAYAALSRQPLIASILGGIAAGLECEREGNIPIQAQEVLERIDQLEKMANYEGS